MSANNSMKYLMAFGGPAYPCQLQGKARVNPQTMEIQQQMVSVPGVSVHHYFAGKALGSMRLDLTTDATNVERIAGKCLAIADAMMDAYNKKIEGMEKDESGSKEQPGTEDKSNS